MNNINKENIQETKPEDYNDKYFKYLCILPWICLGLWLLEIPVLLASWKAVELVIEGNHDAFDILLAYTAQPGKSDRRAGSRSRGKGVRSPACGLRVSDRVQAL